MSSTSIRTPDIRRNSGYQGVSPGWSDRWRSRPGMLRFLAGGAGLVALAALALGLRPEPQPSGLSSASAASPAADVALVTPPEPVPLGPALAEAPPPRPAVRRPVATLATRDLPRGFLEPRREVPTELRLAELTTARVRLDGLITSPLHRPALARRIDAAAPMPRPAAEQAVITPEPSAAIGPRPRPAGGAVAAVEPASAAAGLAAAAVAAPPARPAATVHSVAAPVAARQAAVQPKAVRPAAPVQTVRAQPTRVVRQAPQPQVTVRQTARPETAAGFAALTRRSGVRGVSLIGVFGSSDDRHALVRLPNGAVERVHAGDSIQGAQVAAVGADSVRLRGGGRETVLTLPE